MALLHSMKLAAVLGCAVLLLAACGGGGGNAATDEIKAAYRNFFTTKTSLAQHVALLENGEKFKPLIRTFLDLPGANGVSATVSKVTMQGPDTAKVVYTVKVAGLSFPDRPGYAVRQNGKWKVTDSTLCGLIALSGDMPAACNR
ncbi:MAG: hypothetical protein QOG85_2559 [Gaiellaceae bacterium]|jgi:hypothetical protein|nr:hypothetical protein [Gaiellaceae bacterium]